jgi:hypothetical protein
MPPVDSAQRMAKGQRERLLLTSPSSVLCPVVSCAAFCPISHPYLPAIQVQSHLMHRTSKTAQLHLRYLASLGDFSFGDYLLDSRRAQVVCFTTMPNALQWIAGILLAILLNVTANRLPERFHDHFLRWGWFSVSLYFTYLIMSIDFIQRRLAAFGGSSLGSYALAGTIGALLGIAYLTAINRANSLMTRVPEQTPSTQAAHSASTTQAQPTTTPAPQPTTASVPPLSQSPTPITTPTPKRPRSPRKRVAHDDTEDILLGRKKRPSNK